MSVSRPYRANELVQGIVRKVAAQHVGSGCHATTKSRVDECEDVAYKVIAIAVVLDGSCAGGLPVGTRIVRRLRPKACQAEGMGVVAVTGENVVSEHGQLLFGLGRFEMTWRR